MVHADKLGQVTIFTTFGGTAKHCVNQYIILFRYCSLGGDTAIPSGLHARLKAHESIWFLMRELPRSVSVAAQIRPCTERKTVRFFHRQFVN